jgi:FkbM family methyltransferase
MTRIEYYRMALRNLGAPSLIRLKAQKYFGAVDEMTLTSQRLDYPVVARRHTTDSMVFHQIFVEHEYECLAGIEATGLIVDLGANVGFSSAYLLSRFPLCSAISVEPDPKNYQVLVRNVRPYLQRQRTINAAVWPHREDLGFDPSSNGPGKEWARRVLPLRGSVGDGYVIETINVPEIISLSGFERISLLKIDIEGAEEELFKVGAYEWIDKVDNIVIELHGERSSSAFFKVVSSEKFMITLSGELTVCRRR